jgi:PII-like signaling protein
MAQIKLADIQREWAGLWVAVKDGKVVDARESAHALVLSLKSRDIEGATVLRCPSEGERELVGLG